MIFNKRGLTLKSEYSFLLGGEIMEVTNEYQYLGLKIKPSGAMNYAVDELNAKATKAWFSISKVLYKHKRMEVNKSLQIFDSTLSPSQKFLKFYELNELLGKFYPRKNQPKML